MNTDSCQKRWTKSAIYCYEIGCNCKKCSLPKTYDSLKNNNCKMKAVVLGLVKKFGSPKER